MTRKAIPVEEAAKDWMKDPQFRAAWWLKCDRWVPDL